MIDPSLIAREGFAAGVDSASTGGWDLNKAANVATVAGFIAAVVGAILGLVVSAAKAIYWILGKFFSDPLRAEIKALRDDMNRRWDLHDERAEILIERVHGIEQNCTARHVLLSPKEGA